MRNTIFVSLVLLVTSAHASDSQPRDALGDALPKRAVARLGTLRMRDPLGHTPRVAISPKANYAASTGDGNTVRIWDLESGKEVRRLPGLGDCDWQLAPVFSSDGKRLAAEYREPTNKNSYGILVWDFPSGKERHRLAGANSRVYSFDFTTSGETLIALCGKEQGSAIVRQWNLKTGKLDPSAHTLIQDDGSAIAITSIFSPDRKRIALQWYIDTGDAPATSSIRIFDITAEKELWRAEDVGKLRVAMRFSDDGENLNLVLPSGKVETRRVLTGKLVKHFPGPHLKHDKYDRPPHVAFANDGNSVAVTNLKAGEPIVIFPLVANKKPRQMSFEHHFFSSIFTSDDRRLLTVKGDQLYLFDLKSGKEVFLLPGHRGSIYHLYFSQDGKTLSSGTHGVDLGFPFRGGLGYPRECIVWNTATWSADRRTKVPLDWVEYRPVPASMQHEFSVSSRDSKDLEVRSFTEDKLLRVLKVRPETKLHPNGLVSPDGRLLVSRTDNKMSLVVDIESDKKICTLPVDCNVDKLAFVDGKRIIAWKSPDQRIGVFDASRDMPLFYLKEPSRTGPPIQLTFSQDGRTLVALDGGQRQAVIWDLATRKIVAAFPKEPIPRSEYWTAECLAISPNNKYLAIGGIHGQGKDVSVWEVSTGKLVRRFAGHEAVVRVLAWSPDSQVLASGSDDTTVLIWSMD